MLVVQYLNKNKLNLNTTKTKAMILMSLYKYNKIEIVANSIIEFNKLFT